MRDFFVKKWRGIREETAAALFTLIFTIFASAIYAAIVLALGQSVKFAALTYAFSALAVASMFSSAWKASKIIRNIGLTVGTLGTIVMLFMAVVEIFL